MAVERLKSGVDAMLRSALQSDVGEQLPQAKQEELANEAIEAAKEIDSIFEQVKLDRPNPGAEDVQREIGELQALLAVKDELLQKSLDCVSTWEAKFAQLRSSQKTLLHSS
eukprot:CAMPEP_0181293124 /NCGR_PEP_ID=MMETSP1101-20121128/2893_1 /TAXON_ID=46948 /ORGANISM="Rhodomonas abbreviata, Strain Caron Lab Isolate" /LENGTH=110 /DNA_ID=CAMNT_0023397681 /DNA_START=122 /DNA_END=454 /DNA_ORIENTATION=+